MEQNHLIASATAAQELSKQYEYTVLSHDPLYNVLVDANKVVMEYIASRNLILYGGIAIDYALKLAGAEGIYPEALSATPDLDFYSPDSVNDAYRLADMLFTRGYEGARAIAALHIETMRVDCGDKHWVADISFRAKSIFDELPTLIWRGMRIVHPHFQRLDMHSALSIPYDNPPREVIFARWAKDIKRFNLLDKYYPLEPMKGFKMPKMHMRTIPASVAIKHVWTGFNAYALIYAHAAKIGVDTAGCISLACKDGAFQAPFEDAAFSVISFKPLRDIEELAPGAKVRAFEPYANIVPRTYLADEVCVFDSSGALISCGEIEDSVGSFIRVVNAQYLLKHFLGMYYVAPKERRGVYREFYCSLMELVRRAESKSIIDSPILGISIETYGGENASHAKHMQDARAISAIEGGPLPPVQKNYYPARGNGHPDFDPEKISYFHDDGREIAIEPREIAVVNTEP